MRLWTLHPRYLDGRGLTALWREGLLAQRVLQGRTKGYRSHPQLQRFRGARDPLGAIASYLAAVREEAAARGYRFDARRIARSGGSARLRATRGQLRYEWRHLLGKLKRRAPGLYRKLRGLGGPRAHPLFRLAPGPVSPWERP